MFYLEFSKFFFFLKKGIFQVIENTMMVLQIANNPSNMLILLQFFKQGRFFAIHVVFMVIQGDVFLQRCLYRTVPLIFV